MSPVLYSREATVARVVQKIHELGQQGVQFATFPETVIHRRPELVSLLIDRTPTAHVHERAAHPASAAGPGSGELLGTPATP